ncbi:MAG: histidinol-phosphate transaminase [Ruminococcaceae bacterium]|nr:histidinol-phosphate transaminase [Oscillospiraceae bacterium]
MNKYIPEKIDRMTEYVPNKGDFSVRLDANESPYLPSEELRKRIEKAAFSAAFNRYPDASSEDLINAFCKRFGISPKQTAAGNGSDELINVISTVFLTPEDKVLICPPDFSMYAFYPETIGAEIVRVPRENGYVNSDEIIKYANEEKVKMILFSNPCNPSGRLMKKEEVVYILERTDCILVCDEAYMEFSSKDESVMELCGKYDRLIVLKTLSKAFGIAGLRVGFAVSNEDIGAAIRKVKSPYNVNSFSQAAATVILNDGWDEINEKYEIIKKNTEALRIALDGIGYPSERTDTNFVLIRTERAKEIFDKLSLKGIAIRCFSSDNLLRITCGTEKENEALIDALKSI